MDAATPSLPRKFLRRPCGVLFGILVLMGIPGILSNCISSAVRFAEPKRTTEPERTAKPERIAGTQTEKPASNGDDGDFGALLSENSETGSPAAPDTSRIRALCSSYLGTCYHYSGASKAGMDCSGLVGAVFKELGRPLTARSSRELQKLGSHIALEDARSGDLLFFKTKHLIVDHVGIYIGNGRFIHASTKLGVIESDMNDDYYRNHFIEARRMLP